MSRKALVPANVLALASAPSSPALSAGDLYFNTSNNILYVYDGVVWSPASGGGSVTVSDTQPTGAIVGDLWFNSASTRMFVYYDSYWIEASPPVSAVGQLDGGFPNSTYGGISPIDAGGVG